jgi:hypothetical protein
MKYQTSIYGQLQKKTNRFQIKEIKWKLIGHAVRSEYSIARDALRWNPQAKRKAGRLGNTLRRTILIEARGKGWSWYDLRRMADNRVRWRLYAPSGVTVTMMMTMMISQTAVIF